MFHSKQDVDRHVNEVFRNIKSEYQRNLKCYQIAKLYYKFKDYKSAIKYINRYILTTSNSAVAYRFLGECYLAINLKLKALDAFKTSLELNGSQNELVLKVCSILMDPEVSSVTPRATYWLERAESLFPTNSVVFRLKEHLLKSNTDEKQDNGKLEKLLLSEVNAKPTNAVVRIRLLNFFVETKRFKIAYVHALAIEERDFFSNDPRWYDCLCNVVQAYEKSTNDLDFSFFIKKIIFLEKRADLYMQEYQDEVKTLPECSSALFDFDQNLHLFAKIEVPQDESYFYNEFLKHMRAQLSFHLATLVLKRAQKEYGIWPKAFCTSSPLLLLSTQDTMDLDDAWYNLWNGKCLKEAEVKKLSKSAALRVSQAGHVLLAWSQNKGSKFLEKVNQFCGGKWQVQAYPNIFYNKIHRQATVTSHFVNDNFFSNVPMRLLSETELVHYDEISQSAYPDSLHHLVWLGLSYCNSNGQLSHDFRCMTVPELQFTVENLSQFGPETLNQLDVDAFLYASVICAKSVTPNVVATDRPTRLPISISDELCSTAQSEWWAEIYKIYKNQPPENIADRRLKLRRGIETIRAFGQHGLHVKVLVMLAKLFQERAAKNKNPNELNGLEERAHLYWTAAIPLLEKVEKNLHNNISLFNSNSLFNYRGKDLTSTEIKGYLEDGRLFLACKLMKQGRHEQAIEAFQLLKSPYATFYQGLIYEKLASEEVSHRPESITSENRSQHIILLTRARDAFYLTLDRLRCPSVDPNHPLNAQLQDHLESIEEQLGMIDPDTAIVNRNGDSESDETGTVPCPLSPVVDEHLDTSFNVFNTSNFFNMKNHSASRGLQNFSEKQHNPRIEARPSPERLDAQLRHFVQTNNNGLHSMVEVLKEIKSVLQIELKDLRCVTRDLLAETKRLGEKIEAFKRDPIKPEDILELREDFEDLSQLSQYASYPNYQINRPAPVTQGTSTVSYGTPVPSPVPPVPSVLPVIPTSENPLIPPPYYPGMHSVPPIDPSLLLYQTIGYYAQGMPAYGENQNVPDYRGTGIQKGAPFAKNAYKDPVVTTKAQPPNVVITSSDTLPTFTSAGTPSMSVTVPPQHIRGLTPSPIAQKQNSGQLHPFQIQMPPQAQLVKEFPMEKLNLTTTTTSLFTNSIQAPIVSTLPSHPTQVQQTPLPSEINLTKSTPPKIKTEDTPTWNQTPENKVKSGKENKLFECRGKLSVMVDKEWKDFGLILIKVVVDKKSKKAQIVMLQEHLLRVFADHFITHDMALEPSKASDNEWIWTASCLNKADSKPSGLAIKTPSAQRYCVRFNSFDEAKDFEFAFNEGLKIAKEANKTEVVKAKPVKESIETIKKECKNCKATVEGNTEKCSSCIMKDKLGQNKTKLGGFTFVSSPIVETPISKLNEQKEKTKEATKPSPFADFSFSGSHSTATTTTATTTVTSTSNNPPFFTSKEQNATNLFASVKYDPNSFKKDANFKGFGGNTLVFGNFNKSQTKSEKPAVSKSGNEDEEEGDEFVPTAEFTPVVKLPELVDVKTGEESDTVLYEERAKLLRFDSNLKEWKERGVGPMKMLLNEETGKVRLIMRRDLVFKVCCNHYVDENMEFKRLTKSDKALTWYAQDYSEEDLKAECFALRFKSPEAMAKFEGIIKNTQSKMKNGRVEGGKQKEAPPDDKSKEQKPLSALFKPKAGSWECDVCMVRNDEKAKVCVSCETPKPGTETAPKDPAPQPGGLGKGITFPPTTTKFTFGIPQTSATTTTASIVPSTTSKLIFGTPSTTTNFNNFTFGSPRSESSETKTEFSFGIPSCPSTTTSTSSSISFSFGAKETTKPSNLSGSGFSLSAPKLNFSSANITTVSSADTFTLSKTLSTSTPPSVTLAPAKLTFSTPSVSIPTTKSEQGSTVFDKPFTFNFSKAKENVEKSETGTPQTSFSFMTATKPEEKFKFSLSNSKAAEKTLPSKTTPPAKGKLSGTDAASDGSEGETAEDNGDDIVVTPVIPLPEKVPVHTGEEDEDVLFERRARLFRFAKKEWKERGIGEIKILKHRKNNKIRLLMRRDAILKVCLNHYLTPEIDFTYKNENSLQWCAADFSDEEVKMSMFAIRFKTPEIAQEFKKIIEDVKKGLSSAKKEDDDKPKEPTDAMKNFTFAVPAAPKQETPKSSQSGDEDIMVVYENKVTPEQREKAISLQLPPNFYAYLQARDCPGCPGCEKDDEPAQPQPQSQPTSLPNATTPFASKSIFQTSTWGSLNFGGFDNPEGKVMFAFGGNQAATKQKFEGLKPGPILSEDVEEMKDEEEEDDQDYDEDDDGEDDDEDRDDDDDNKDNKDDDDDNEDDKDDDDDDDDEGEEEEEDSKFEEVGEEGMEELEMEEEEEEEEEEDGNEFDKDDKTQE